MNRKDEGRRKSKGGRERRKHNKNKDKLNERKMRK